MMKQHAKVVTMAGAALLLTLATGGSLHARSTMPCRQRPCRRKWMTGDFHQHTYYTDGSNPMNDLTAPGVIATSAVTDPVGLYRKGVMPRDSASASTSRPTPSMADPNRDGFGNSWTTYGPSPVIGEDIDHADEHVALAVPHPDLGHPGLLRSFLHGGL